MKKISLFLISFLFFCDSYAYITGNMLLPVCEDAIKVDNNNGFATNYYRSQQQINDQGMCLGYVAAMADLGNQTFFCVPPNSTYGQDVRIFVKYLNNHPEKLNVDGVSLVYQSLKQAFPCPSTPPTKK
jgi:hypothetical protein